MAMPEVWLRGPLENIPSLLQPVAHALLQAREEINVLLQNFPEEKLWLQPAGMASTGFHLHHLTGVLNRLFTYANGHALTAAQLHYLSMEGKPFQQENIVQNLVLAFNNEVDKALQQISTTDEQTLTQPRGVGRAQLPSTVMGLLFHAAEHTMRHLGQLIVTVAVVKQQLQ